MKVYCDNCKYLYRDVYTRSWACLAPENIEKKDTPICIYDKIRKTPMQLNSKNKCKFYKRKWYKFWIKTEPEKIGIGILGR